MATLPKPISASHIRHLRLYHQLIAYHPFNAPAAVVRHLGAIQAQDYAGALWSIGLRLPAATAADIEQAVADGSIVRTWPMRGTLHFVAAEDVRWMLEFLTPRVIAKSARRHKQLALDDATFVRGVELFAQALQGSPPQTRAELMAVLEQGGIAITGQRGYHILWWAAQHGYICCGPRRGKQHTFVWLDDWVSATRRWDRDEALGELAARYFTGHGPATLHDFMWWSGLTAADARSALALAEPRLVQYEEDDQRYWAAAEPPEFPLADAGVYLLPGFDEYLLGYTDRCAVLAPEFTQRIHPGKNGIFKPTIILDGRVVGIWSRKLKRRTVDIEGTPFINLDDAQSEAMRAAAARYATFVERTPAVAFSSIVT